METIQWIAKEITRAGGAFVSAVAAYKLNDPPWLLVTVATLVGG